MEEHQTIRSLLLAYARQYELLGALGKNMNLEQMQYADNFTKQIENLIKDREDKLLQRVEEEVIGEDMPDKEWDEKCPCGTTHHYETSHFKENRLKSQQRQALSLLRSDETKEVT